MAQSHKSWLLAGGALVAAAGYYYYQNYTVQTTAYWVENPALQKIDGMKIVQLSDLNLPKQHVPLKKIVRAVADANPDLIALTGNLLAAAGIFDQEAFEDFAAQLVAIAPTYAVYGRHEVVNPYARKAEELLAAQGVHFLNDAAETVDYHGQGVTLLGLYEKPQRRFLAVDPLRLITLTEPQQQQPKILLAHHPEAFLHYHDEPDKAPDVTLAGHAEGGNWRLPVVGPLFAPGQGTQPKFVDGVFALPSDPNKKLVISRGIGQPTCGLRVGNRPEVVSIQLTHSIQATSAALTEAVDNDTREAGGWTFEEAPERFRAHLAERRYRRIMEQQ